MADKKRILLIGCGVVALLSVLCGGGFFGFIWYASEDVQGVTVSFEQPDEVKVGETFDLGMLITNNRPKQSLKVGDIDIDNAYLSGFVLVSCQPTYKSTMDIPLVDMRSFTFGLEIPAKQTQTVTFKLKAVQEGLHGGDVDINEGARSRSTFLQTNVGPAE